MLLLYANRARYVSIDFCNRPQLDSPNCMISLAIGLWIMRAAGHMLKLILHGEA